jgi:hypothetical protein
MFRLLFGILIGALIVYLADSRYVDDRRRMLKDRLNGARGDFSDRAEDAVQAGRESFEDARSRAGYVSERASARARETFDEARGEAREWAAATQDRADSLTDSGPKR